MKASVHKKLLDALSRASPQQVVQDFPGVGYNTILSIWSQSYTHAIRRTHHIYKSQKAIAGFVQRYHAGETLVQIAGSLSIRGCMTFAPCLLARFFLSHLLPKSTKQEVTLCMRDPRRIQDQRLRQNVQQCIEQDLHYSPHATKIRQVMGLKYEFVLEAKLRNRGIPFATEESLRAQGTFSTPDIRLLVPISISGRLVRWIDSKAMFGDVYTHKQNQKQFQGYINRYGPGLVIYWFDFVEQIVADSDEQNPDIMVLNCFPDDIQTLSSLSSSVQQGHDQQQQQQQQRHRQGDS